MFSVKCFQAAALGFAVLGLGLAPSEALAGGDRHRSHDRGSSHLSSHSDRHQVSRHDRGSRSQGHSGHISRGHSGHNDRGHYDRGQSTRGHSDRGYSSHSGSSHHGRTYCSTSRVTTHHGHSQRVSAHYRDDNFRVSVRLGSSGGHWGHHSSSHTTYGTSSVRYVSHQPSGLLEAGLRPAGLRLAYHVLRPGLPGLRPGRVLRPGLGQPLRRHLPVSPRNSRAIPGSGSGGRASPMGMIPPAPRCLPGSVGLLHRCGPVPAVFAPAGLPPRR